MDWTPLPRGALTGIDWSQPGATTGYDPYLVWAEADGFAGYGGRVPEWLPVAVELQPGMSIAQMVDAGSPAWLQVPPVYTSAAAPQGFRFCTARVRRGFFDALQAGGPLERVVKRVEMGLAADAEGGGVGDQALVAPPAAAVAPGKGRPAPDLLAGPVFGLIDDSIALVHANMLDAKGGPRTAFFWRQDGRGQGSTPAGMGYGHELTAADIQAAMKRCTRSGVLDESAAYTALGLSTLGEPSKGGRPGFHALDTHVSHGTHVADIAVGPRTVLAQMANVPPHGNAPPTWAQANDRASRCAIVAVQLDHDTVRDTSGGAMNVRLLDALMYLLSRCTPSARIVANISFGTLAGPHDGSSLLETAMDQLLELCAPRLDIVIAAGNSYQLRTHANVQLQPGARKAEPLHWAIQPDDRSQSFLELWIEEGRKGVQVEVTPPGLPALPPRTLGESGMWTDAAGRPLCALIYPERVATGERGTCALLALAPTFSFAARTATAPSGVWKVALRNNGAEPAVVDGYIERDDVVAGTRSGARQSHFVDDPSLPPEQQYDMQAFVDDPNRKTPIRRSGNFNSIATGSRTLSVGGRRVTDREWAHYSPRSPDPDAGRPSRPGVVKVPDRHAYSDESAALAGLSAAGTRSSGMARLAGTSDAAPQVARQII